MQDVITCAHVHVVKQKTGSEKNVCAFVINCFVQTKEKKLVVSFSAFSTSQKTTSVDKVL